MKNLCLCLCAIILTSSLIAQEKRKEVSINLGNSNNYGISYRFGTAKSLWRLNLLSGNIGISNLQNETIFSNGQDNDIDYYEYNNTGYGIGVSIGKEFRNTITNKVEFRYGFDIGFNYSHGTNESTNNYNNSTDLSVYKSKYNSYTTSINGVLGFNYILNKHLALGIEVLPEISYRIGNTTGTRIYEDENDIEDFRTEGSSSQFYFDLNNNSARLSIAYRF